MGSIEHVVTPQMPADSAGAQESGDVQIPVPNQGAVGAEADSPAQDPGAQAPPAENLIGGKFKSQDELLAAYQELERSQSQRGQEGNDAGQETQDATADAQAPATPPGMEGFEKWMGEFGESGTLSDASIDEIVAEKGIPKPLVEQYVRSFRRDLEFTMRDNAQAIFTAVGGEDSYKDMIAWAGENLEAGAIEAYNRVISGSDEQASLLAVRGLQAEFRRQAGQPAAKQFVGTEPKGPSSAQPYRDRHEVLAAMGNPLYKQSQAYRDDVERRLAVTDDNVF